MLHVPFARRDRIGAEHVYVPEVVMACRVEFDQCVIWAIDVGVEEAARIFRSTGHAAYICYGCLKLRTAIELSLVRALHVLCAPTNMPNARDYFRRRWCSNFSE